MLDLVLKGIQAIGFERIRLYLLSDDEQYLIGESHLGMDDHFAGAKWPIMDIPLFREIFEEPRTRLLGSPGEAESLTETPLNGDEVGEWVCAPLVNGRVRGIITADNKHSRNSISEEILPLMTLFASQAAEAIALAKDFVNTKLHATQLEALERTTLGLTSSLALPALLTIIIQQAVHLLAGESGGIYEYYQERGELVVAAEHNRPDYIGRVLKVGEGMAGRLVQDDNPALNSRDETSFSLNDGTPFRVVDNYNDWPGRASIYEDGRPFESVIEVPLKWKDRIIGVLYVDAQKGRRFTHDDAHLLKSFADHAAIAMNDAALRDRSETKLKKLGRLSGIMKELMGDLGTKSLEERLYQVALYAAEILNAEVCGVFLVKEPGVLSLEASFGHREGSFQKGKRLTICEGVGTGLTGHIAAREELFNSNGEKLNNHPAVRGVEPDCTPSGICSSLLAIPLQSTSGGQKKLAGLIRVSNKKDDEGRTLPSLRFNEEDEWILTIFAEAVITALEGARLVNELSEQKEKLLRMVTSSPNGIIAADRAGNITEFNEQARNIVGYAPDEPLPSNIREVYLSEKDARRVGAELHRQQGKVEKLKTAIRTKDGIRVPIQLSATWLYNTEMERVGGVGYFEDLRGVEAAEKRRELFLEANSIVATADSPAEGLQNLAEKLISLLNNSFCRILLLDESEQHLSVEAAYPIARHDSEIDWNPRRGERVALSEYEGLKTFLESGGPTVVQWSDDSRRPLLEKFSRRIGLHKPVQSLLMVPLRLGKKVVGLLDIGELRAEKKSDSIPEKIEGNKNAERRGESFSHAFTEDKIEVVASVAAQTCFLIERIKLYQVAERRRRLLERLDEKALELRSVKELEKLQYDVVRLALELVERKEEMDGILFVNHPLQQILEPKVTFKLDRLPSEPLPYEDGPIGKVAKTGKSEIISDYSVWAEREGVFTSPEYHSMIAIPLSHGGEVKYVLAIADKSESLSFGVAELEALERFASQAAIALQTAQLLSSEQGRRFRHLSILHQITEYVLSEKDFNKILNAVLTGITAGYGLGFNRAVLLLLNETGDVLEGGQGIGHLDQRRAEEDWASYHHKRLDTFPAYIEELNRGHVQSTPVGEWCKRYNLILANDRSGHFKRAVNDRAFKHISPSQLKELPRDFFYSFKPTTEMVILPLHAHEKSVGILIVDNKFSKVPISTEDVNSLLTYANTAALAIDNLRLIHRIEVGREKMQSLFKAGTTLRTTNNPTQMLSDIIELTYEAAEADWVRIIRIDELGRPHALISKGTENEPALEDVFLPDGIGQKVMQTGEATKVENTHEQPGLNPLLRHKDPEALLCLPLAMHGRKFGVMWIGYKAPRLFQEIFINALQLYVNQAAIAYDSAQRMEELEQLRLAAEALAGVDDPQSVLDQIVLRARIALRADSAAIWTYDDVLDHFVQEGWVSSNIAPELREEFWKAQPRFGGTARTVMKKGLISVTTIQDEAAYSYLGSTTRRLLGRIGVQSFLGISLSAGEEKLGVLYINYNRPRNFSEEEEETARTFANHAALALKRAKLLDQVQKVKKAAEWVAKVTTVGDHEQTLSEIVKGMKAALGCSSAILFTYDKTTQTLKHPPYFSDGVSNPAAAMSYKEVARDSIIYKILERERAEFIERAEEAPLTATRRFRIEEGIKSLVAIPLTASNEKVGVMFVNYNVQHRFTDEEKDNIELFANQAAAVILNAQLFEKRFREKSDLLDLSKHLLETSGLAETMQTAVDKAAKMLQAEFCAIVLPEEEGDDLAFSAAHGWDENLIRKLKLKSAHGSQTGYTIEQRGPVVVENFDLETRFNVHPILRELGLQSSMSVPMFKGDEVIGAILIHSRQPRRFSEEEVGLLTLIANQTAVAMQRASQFEEINRKRRNLDALYEASKAITASFRPNPQQVLSGHKSVLDEIVKQAVEGITGVVGPKATLGMIKLYDEASNELVFESIYPTEKKAELLKLIGERRSVSEESPDGQPLGVVARAVKTGRTLLVPDVRLSPYYINYDPTTLSELVVPLIIEGKVRGVINVESDHVNGFDKDDVTNLQALAELAVVFLKNAELFNELIEAKGIADSSRALARMGMISSIWRHAIEGHAINIKNLPTLMRSDIRSWNLTAEQSAKVEERLKFIESMSEKILRKESVPLLSPEETIEVISVNDLIHDRVNDLWKSEPHCRTEHQLNLAPEELKVRANPDWCRRALDILIDNAIEAMIGCETRRVTISTRKVKNEVEISISDTGRGIAPERAEKLLKKPVPVDEGQKGFGVGLLLAKTIVETYNGKISLKETSSHGTTFVITLPAAV